jgi:hypothetical protein
MRSISYLKTGKSSPKFQKILVVLVLGIDIRDTHLSAIITHLIFTDLFIGILF